MGLDMYLTQSVYIGTPLGKNERSGELEIKTSLSSESLLLPFAKIKAIELEFLYWRKANHIHKWFVDNIQDGNDDCGRYHLAEGDFLKLYRDLKLAILKQDPTIFPPAEGMFFGSTKIDNYYWQEINRTAATLKPIIDELEKDYGVRDPVVRLSDFYYTSSW